MVMITRSAYRKATESSNSSDISQNNIIGMPPWCSSGKVYERRKPRRVPSWEVQSSYPLRENIWEYLNDKSNFSATQTHPKVKKIKRHGKRRIVKLFLCLLIGFGLIVPYWFSVKIPNTALLKSVLEEIKLLSFGNVHSTSVSEECCDRLRYLTLALARIEQELRSTVSLRRKVLLSSPSTNTKVTNKNVTIKSLIRGARAIKGSKTKEFGARVALWGVVPLWRTSPPPDTILALRQPKPSDCWPFRRPNHRNTNGRTDLRKEIRAAMVLRSNQESSSTDKNKIIKLAMYTLVKCLQVGALLLCLFLPYHLGDLFPFNDYIIQYPKTFNGSSGEVMIELPHKLTVNSISVEHVRPDTARSAPKNFVVYGVLENGTYVKAVDGMYEYNKPAKQYFSLNNRIALKRIVFRVLSNQGNVKYTCLYRVHLYRSYDNKFII